MNDDRKRNREEEDRSDRAKLLKTINEQFLDLEPEKSSGTKPINIEQVVVPKRSKQDAQPQSLLDPSVLTFKEFQTVFSQFSEDDVVADGISSAILYNYGRKGGVLHEQALHTVNDDDREMVFEQRLDQTVAKNAGAAVYYSARLGSVLYRMSCRLFSELLPNMSPDEAALNVSIQEHVATGGLHDIILREREQKTMAARQRISLFAQSLQREDRRRQIAMFPGYQYAIWPLHARQCSLRNAERVCLERVQLYLDEKQSVVPTTEHSMADFIGSVSIRPVSRESADIERLVDGARIYNLMLAVAVSLTLQPHAREVGGGDEMVGLANAWARMFLSAYGGKNNQISLRRDTTKHAELMLGAAPLSEISVINYYLFSQNAAGADLFDAYARMDYTAKEFAKTMSPGTVLRHLLLTVSPDQKPMQDMQDYSLVRLLMSHAGADSRGVLARSSKLAFFLSTSKVQTEQQGALLKQVPHWVSMPARLNASVPTAGHKLAVGTFEGCTLASDAFSYYGEYSKRETTYFGAEFEQALTDAFTEAGGSKRKA